MYLDLIMLLNFGVDYLLLLGTERLAGGIPDRKGILLAAVLGALYSGGCLIPGFYFLGCLWWRVVFLGMMSALAFGVGWNTWKKTGIFLVLSLALGGMAELAGRGRVTELALCGGLLWLLCRMAFEGSVGRTLIPAQIRHGTQVLHLTALKDTGNTLRDPFTGEQVMILGCGQAQTLTGFTQDQLAHPLETLEQNPTKGLRLIPYHGVGQQGVLLGMRLNEVCWGGKCRPTVVAFSPDDLGAGKFQALLGGMA